MPNAMQRSECGGALSSSGAHSECQLEAMLELELMANVQGAVEAHEGRDSKIKVEKREQPYPSHVAERQQPTALPKEFSGGDVAAEALGGEGEREGVEVAAAAAAAAAAAQAPISAAAPTHPATPPLVTTVSPPQTLSADRDSATNLAGDHHARSRERAWPLLAVWTEILAPSATDVQDVGQISDCYKGETTARTVPATEGQHEGGISIQKIDKLPAVTIVSGDPLLVAVNHTSHAPLTTRLSVASSSSSSSVTSSIPSDSSTYAASTANTAIPTVSTLAGPSFSCSAPSSPLPLQATTTSPHHQLALTQRRLIRRQKSRELSAVRKSLAAAFTPIKRMDHPSRQHFARTNSTPVARLGGATPPQGETSLFATPTGTELAQFVDDSQVFPRPNYLVASSLNMSSDSLNSQYSHDGAIAPGRPHSMSSLHNTPAQEDLGEPFATRRGSDPTYTTSNDPGRLERQYQPITGFNRAWPGRDYDLTVDQHLAESSEMDSAWWDDKTRSSTEEWVGRENETPQGLSQAIGGEFHLRQLPEQRAFGTEGVRQPIDAYGEIAFTHQPSSPLHGESDMTDLGALVGSPTDPSPPESPGFHFSAKGSHLNTPELGYPMTPAVSQACFPGIYQSPHQLHNGRTSNSPTPPPTGLPRSASAAAVAALAATKQPQRQLRQVSSRAGTSRRQKSNSSLRATAKIHAHAPSLSPNTDDISFVNFTPDDASRILSGVAPSGSSKTKARREREAQERRRKFSEAAAAAVLAAGGDVSQLAKVAGDLEAA